jgi:aromatic ring hydroxylase
MCYAGAERPEGETVGARTGQEYIDRLAQTRPVVEINGERIEGPIPSHPALAGVVRTFAELYDLQHDDALRDVLTYDGLRFICREGIDYGRHHPLGSRFDEIDAVVVFDDVRVPWERVFMLGHPELCNGFYTDTGAVVHMTHQVTARTTAKTETFLGLTSLTTETIGIEQFSHIQEDVAEIAVMLSILRALVRAAEADATPIASASSLLRGSHSTRRATGIPRLRSACPRSCASSEPAA